MSARKSARKTPRETPRRKPAHGRGELQVGNPGNRGGGRPPDVFRQQLAEIRDVEGVPLLQQILRGKITATARARGKRAARSVVPSPDTRLRAVELVLKHTLPIEKTVRLEGFQDAQRVFNVVKERIVAVLGAERAAALIADIDSHLSRR